MSRNRQPPSDRAWIDRLSPDERSAMREDYEERAAIVEYEAGLERDEAERHAALTVRRRWEVF